MSPAQAATQTGSAGGIQFGGQQGSIGGGFDWNSLLGMLGGAGGFAAGGLLGTLSSQSAVNQQMKNNQILQNTDQGLLGIVGQAGQQNAANRAGLLAGLTEDQNQTNTNNAIASAGLFPQAPAPGKLLKNDGLKSVYTSLSGIKTKPNTGKFSLLGA